MARSHHFEIIWIAGGWWNTWTLNTAHMQSWNAPSMARPSHKQFLLIHPFGHNHFERIERFNEKTCPFQLLRIDHGQIGEFISTLWIFSSIFNSINQRCHKSQCHIFNLTKDDKWFRRFNVQVCVHALYYWILSMLCKVTMATIFNIEK